MKRFLTTVIAIGALFLSGCESGSSMGSSATEPTVAIPFLATEPREFFLHPKTGVYRLRKQIGSYNAVKYDNLHADLGYVGGNGEFNSIYRHGVFKAELPNIETLSSLSRNADEAAIERLMGSPGHTGYDLLPVLDSLIVPITPLFGKNWKNISHQAFTITEAGELVELGLGVTYEKNESGEWRQTSLRWRFNGERNN